MTLIEREHMVRARDLLLKAQEIVIQAIDELDASLGLDVDGTIRTKAVVVHLLEVVTKINERLSTK